MIEQTCMQKCHNENEEEKPNITQFYQVHAVSVLFLFCCCWQEKVLEQHFLLLQIKAIVVWLVGFFFCKMLHDWFIFFVRSAAVYTHEVSELECHTYPCFGLFLSLLWFSYRWVLVWFVCVDGAKGVRMNAIIRLVVRGKKSVFFCLFVFGLCMCVGSYSSINGDGWATRNNDFISFVRLFL